MLQYSRIQKVEEGAIVLEGGGTVSGPAEVGTGEPEETEIELSALLTLLSGRIFADEAFGEVVVAELLERI